MKNPIEHFTKSILHSSAQIMLQTNSIAGMLFLVGIGINSIVMLLGCILAILSSLVAAKLLHYNGEAIQKGFYGFNAALVGIAVFYLLPANLTAVFFVIFGGALSAMIMHFMFTKIPAVPALTAPFILTIWLIVLIIDFAGIDYAGVEILAEVLPKTLAAPNSLSFIGSWSLIDLIRGAFRGIGQVMLQDNWLSGVLFCCALLFSSYKTVLWAILASLIGLLVANYLDFPQEKAVMGLYGFNGCLVAISLAKHYTQKYWFIIPAILFSILLSRVLEQVTVVALTTPFVLTIWLIVAMANVKTFWGNKRKIKKKVTANN